MNGREYENMPEMNSVKRTSPIFTITLDIDIQFAIKRKKYLKALEVEDADT